MNALNACVAASARDQVIAGCDALREQLHGLSGTGVGLSKKIHDLRRLGKAVRGGCALFLLHDTAGREIQSIGRLLSGTRDAASRRQTWLRLEWEGDARLAAAVSSLLYKESRAVIRPWPPQALAWCLDRVDSARQQLRELPERELAEFLVKGLTRLRHRVFRRCGRLEQEEGGSFHAARKAAKAWLGAMEFLPEGIVPSDPALEKVVGWLGDENDLATLSGWLLERGFTDRFAAGLWETVRGSRRKLQRRVIRHLPELRGWPKGAAIR
jgi:hypothetical protein